MVQFNLLMINLLLSFLENWRLGLEIASYVATCLMSFTLIGTAFCAFFYFKNRLTRKTLQIRFSVLTKNSDCLCCSVDFNNYTDKEFSIIECSLHVGGNNSVMKEKIRVGDMPLFDLVPKKNIYLVPHQSITMDYVYFDVKNCNSDKAKFEIKTTQGNLTYKVNLTPKYP